MAFSLFQTVLIGVVLFSVERNLSQPYFLDSLIVLLDIALNFLNAIKFAMFVCRLYLFKAHWCFLWPFHRIYSTKELHVFSLLSWLCIWG